MRNSRKPTTTTTTTTTATTIKIIRATRSKPINQTLKPKRGCFSLATHIFHASMNDNLCLSILLQKGIGSLRSKQLVSNHRGTINSELQKVDEIIVHIGSNDISNGIKKERSADNIEKACRKFRDVNPNIEVSASSICGSSKTLRF